MTSPVFVTGYWRSGTTLLGNILDRHPRLAIFVESFFIPRYYYTRHLYWPLGNVDNAMRLARAIASEDAAKVNGLEVDPASIERARPQTYAGVLDSLMSTWAHAHGKSRWGDKSPGYISKISLLHRMYPDAQFVHIIRDGRDVWQSLRRLSWADDVVDVALDWSHTLRAARGAAQRLPKGRYLELRFEDLVSKPEGEVRRVMRFLSEPFVAGLLEAGVSHGRNPAFSEWPKINAPIGSVPRSRALESLPRGDVALFEAVAGTALVENGYVLSFERLPAGVRARACARCPWAILKRGAGRAHRVGAFIGRALAQRLSRE